VASPLIPAPTINVLTDSISFILTRGPSHREKRA
jgi:hypothetical protein